MRLGFGMVLAALLVVGCDTCGRRGYVVEGVRDCRDDLDCFIARAATCSPAKVTHRAAGVLTRYEITGVIEQRCHVERTQLDPDPRVDGGPIPEPDTVESPERGWRPSPYRRNPQLQQCLYSGEQIVQVMERIKAGTVIPADLEPCYPGAGECGRVSPLAPGCVWERCLLGRVIYSCEDAKRRRFRRCEGMRHRDGAPKCVLNCSEKGQEFEDCRTDKELFEDLEAP